MENRVDCRRSYGNSADSLLILETMNAQDKQCPKCHKDYTEKDVSFTVPKGEKWVYMIECKECGTIFEVKPDYKDWS